MDKLRKSLFRSITVCGFCKHTMSEAYATLFLGGRNYYVTTKEDFWICRNLADAESIKQTHGGSITNFYIHLCTICQN